MSKNSANKLSAMLHHHGTLFMHPWILDIDSVTIFKSKLKTHLLTTVYNGYNMVFHECL